MSVAEILQTLAESKANGMLRILTPHGTRYVLLKNGQIIQVLRSTENENFLHILSAHGVLPQVPASLPPDLSLMDLFAQFLAEAQITKQRVQEILLAQTEEELLTVIGLDHGSYAFYEARSHKDVAQRLQGWHGFGVAIDIGVWWPSHRQLFSQWERLAKGFDQRAVIRFTEKSTLPNQPTWPDRVVAGLIDGSRTFAGVVDQAEVSPVRCRILLATWLASGDLEIVPTSDLPAQAEENLSSQPGYAARLAVAMFGTPQASQGEAILQRALTDIREPTEAAEYLMSFALWRGPGWFVGWG